MEPSGVRAAFALRSLTASPLQAHSPAGKSPLLPSGLGSAAPQRGAHQAGVQEPGRHLGSTLRLGSEAGLLAPRNVWASLYTDSSLTPAFTPQGRGNTCPSCVGEPQVTRIGGVDRPREGAGTHSGCTPCKATQLVPGAGANNG